MIFYFWENYTLINFIKTPIFPISCKTNKKFDFLYFSWDFFVSFSFRTVHRRAPHCFYGLSRCSFPQGSRLLLFLLCFFPKTPCPETEKPIQAFKRTKPIHYYYYRCIILSTTIHDVDSRRRKQKVIIYNRLVVSFEFDLSTKRIDFRINFRLSTPDVFVEPIRMFY